MPNTVVKLTNAESTWLEAAREDRKLLIKEKHICKDVLFALPSFGSGFRVQGSRSGFAAFFIGRCPKVIFKSKVVFKSRVTRCNNDMSSPLEKGRAKGAGWICPAGASFYVAV